jgi:hypothetical protein
MDSSRDWSIGSRCCQGISHYIVGLMKTGCFIHFKFKENLFVKLKQVNINKNYEINRFSSGLHGGLSQGK